MKKIFPVLFLFCCSIALSQPEGYYRDPAVRGDQIVFSAEGDLWIVGLEGGTAQRLTSHPGEESAPAISSDGQTLAFTATYEGPTELYTMPLPGGLPTRWTYERDASIAVGFTPDGKLLYTTRALSTLPNYQLLTLDLGSRVRERIPLAQASDGVFDDSGKILYFARPDDHRNNTKRYQGGTARNIWKFRIGGTEAENLTADFPGEDHSPMFWNGRVYYVNDRDGTMNIWSMDPDGGDRRQHTRHSGWDVLGPSQGDGRIVYQVGADLWLLDIATDQARKVPITLASDLDQLREKWVDNPMEYLTSAHLSHDGSKVVLTSRGRVFVAPAKQGRLVRASVKEGIRYRDVGFMPDGENLLALSDESGEFEFSLLPANGVGEERALTSDGEILRFLGVPSPDGKWVAYSDLRRDLWVLNVETGEQKKISTNEEGTVDLEWSPDSRWIVFSQRSTNSFNQIHLYELESGELTPLTTDRINSFSPYFSPDGKYIYFLSDRNLISVVGGPWGHRQPEPYFDKMFKVYTLALQKGVRSPFKPDDELSAQQPEEKKEAKDEESAKEGKPEEAAPQPANVVVDREGIQARLKELPIPAGDYSSLSINDKALFWITDEGDSRNLMALKIANKDVKPEQVAEKIRGYEMSGDGKKILISKNSDLYVIDAAPAPAKMENARVDLSNWAFSMNMREDFRQIFIDAWRMERDYFWDPGMHGLDWDAMRDKYLPLVDRVTTRLELSDLIGQLVGELSALHVSVRGGDLREGPEDIEVPSLGARLKRDEGAGGFRIDYIYRSDPDYPDEISPLADPDLDLGIGDVITSINGVDTLSVVHPNALLRNQTGHQVLLAIKPAGGAEQRQVVAIPISDEASLRYSDWEYTRRLAVDEASDNEIGYVHLRAMGPDNLTEWYRNFYPVFNRKGLIIDVRHNRGGNIDSLILEKLIRKAWFYWKTRAGVETWNMQYAFRGHMVVLCNEMTASDGEAFADGFRRLGLGKVIGTRTWGGEIWLHGANRLTD
ncbi:MAG: PD40 domain-containing protein, partial [Acidobacteriota bacterium]